MKETIKEFLDTLNNFTSVDTSMDMVNEIIDKNKNECLCSITIALLFVLVYNKYIK